ncbi:hypothetical protein HDV00_002387 [Rhizophlyctis rosea]|nr:hypothetical protein HDV00_002387 [Rhizophlyctis rosea]
MADHPKLFYETELARCKLLLNDPYRVASIRSLTLGQDLPPELLKFVLDSIDVSLLRNIDTGIGAPGGQDLSPECISILCEALANAAKPLRMKDMYLCGRADVDTTTPALKKFLPSLAGSPLKDITFEFQIPNAIERLHLCFNSVIPTLSELTLSRHFAIDDIVTATPNLEFLGLIEDKDDFLHHNKGPYSLFHLTSLPKLRRLHWYGEHWVESLATIPSNTLAQIVDIQIMSVDGSLKTETEYELFKGTLMKMPALEVFAIDYDSFDTVCDSGVLTFQRLGDIFDSIPSKLTFIRIALGDWDVPLVIEILEKMASLEEAYLVTQGFIRRGDVTRVRAALDWGKEFDVDRAWQTGIPLEEDNEWFWQDEDDMEEDEDGDDDGWFWEVVSDDGATDDDDDDDEEEELQFDLTVD